MLLEGSWIHSRLGRAIAPWSVGVLLWAACASGPAAPAVVRQSASSGAAQASPPSPPAQQPRAVLGDHDCPIVFEGQSLQVAEVDTSVIWGCDLAIENALRVRQGLPTLAPRALLRETVEVALLSREATSRELNRHPDTLGRVRATLADALVRAAARAQTVPASESEIAAYLQTHVADLTRDERVHVRAIGVRTRAAALRIISRLRAGELFETLAQHESVLPGAVRDSGDLGLSPRAGTELIPLAVASAAFGLAEYAAIADAPVTIERTVMVGRGRRRRPRRELVFYVVQRLEHIGTEPPALEASRRRIMLRLLGDRYRVAVAAARTSLLEQARATEPPQLNVEALRLVRLRSASPRSNASETSNPSALNR
ncbi:MAG: hypothetical protein Q8Q09_25330 [Deltaproteobacteria bacterium]|nr:hypothetical protein [Deltaproteobacteria bacterium]